MTHILLVEDDPTLGATLEDRLKREGYGVVLSNTYASALHAFKSDRFNLVVLDVGLPDGSGFELIEKIKKESNVPFIFVTAQSAAEDRLRGYELGAEEFIPKPFHLREFLLRVRHVLANHVQTRPIEVGSVKIDFNAMTLNQGKTTYALTKKEVGVLKILIEKSPEVISRDFLLNEVWGEHEFPSNRTVDNVIVRLRSLLGEASHRIHSVRGIGYKWVGEDHGE